ncbi:DoxX family protein [Fulvivirgaceae bacterium PWU20]|uniref:DoxX family protein n=1 Tax=Chryseosolibacter indicus TaxID=2782351 RepID=A0ABS5VSV9_9BACT|nr:DoxX family protein [Chryseosolibacter indicus]
MKDKKDNVPVTPAWTAYEKVAFRFFFIYFLLQVVPLDWKYYSDLLALDWSPLHFSNIFYAARYTPRFFSDVPVLQDWLVIAVIAIIGTIAWGIVERKNKEYNNLYYWLRVVLRYRLAVALLAYGFIKFFPMQMPEPSLSNLNTNYGDISHWKVFSMSTGIVPNYESFLGLIEISAALLLLYRKTASVGAFIILPFTGNVVMSNLAYEGGEYVYSLLLVSFALFLFAYDIPRLISLTSFEKSTLPSRFKPDFKEDWISNGRIIAKSSFVFIFVFFYGYKTYSTYQQEKGYQYPNSKGLVNARGIYNVKEFVYNGKTLPYAANDPIRWKDVVFEEWATLSIRSNQAVNLVTATTEEIFTKDTERNYEFAGITGRHYYNYNIDSANQILKLVNRNGNYPKDQWTLKYDRTTDEQIVLSGTNPNNDSVYVVLERINKKYLLEEAAKQGRRRGLKL